MAIMIYYKKYDFKQLIDSPTVDAGKVEYINLPLSFDIETSTTPDSKKQAFMYIWQFGINGTAVFGRTWGEYWDFLGRLREALGLCGKRRAIIYVHNLAFEFSFLCGYLPISEVFARAPHHPIYFTTEDGYEYRCSFILTGKSLAMLSRDTKTKKLVGDLDYSKTRHALTPLTAQELAYCENDVLILNEYIAAEIERNGDISKIPLTKTGYVRREVLTAFRSWEEWEKWQKRIQIAYPSLEQFALLNKCFAGGFTHANCRYVDIVLENIASYDLASSYPTQMLKHKYPTGKWHTLTITRREILEKMCEKYACIMQLSFKNLKAKTDHSIISRHKCPAVLGGVFDNGRVVEAEYITLFLTSPDYLIIKQFYDFEAVRIEKFYYAHYEYLPRPMFDTILKLYHNKTALKGYPEGSAENTLYKLSKEYINSLYGMTVTNPLDDNVVYNAESGEWSIEREDAGKLLNKKRWSKKYCLPYAVGVFVTAWARYELLSTVKAITDNSEDGASDVVYCDTDSIKLLNAEKHKDIFELYNEQNRADLWAALDYHGIPRNKIEPLGKTIGIFDYEGRYDRFKTLGAKRYCFEIGGEFNYTVAGLPKSKGSENTPLAYMSMQGADLFDVFEFELYIPPEYSGKLMSIYNTEPWRRLVTDYNGNLCECSERFGVALVPVDFTMSIANEFLKFLLCAQKTASKVLPGLGTKRPELKITPLD